jgi:hypothetical protein
MTNGEHCAEHSGFQEIIANNTKAIEKLWASFDGFKMTLLVGMGSMIAGMGGIIITLIIKK